jgi:hypothetical protein
MRACQTFIGLGSTALAHISMPLRLVGGTKSGTHLITKRWRGHSIR